MDLDFGRHVGGFGHSNSDAPFVPVMKGAEPGHGDRVPEVMEHYNGQTENEAVAEDEASFEDSSQTFMEIPVKLVPKVREINRRESQGTFLDPDCKVTVGVANDSGCESRPWRAMLSRQKVNFGERDESSYRRRLDGPIPGQREPHATWARNGSARPRIDGLVG